MFAQYLSFARVRVFALSYVTCFSIINFIIVLFVLPTTEKNHVASLSVIAVIFLIIGLEGCVALITPRTRPSSAGGAQGKLHIGVEAVCGIASLPLLSTAIVLEAQLRNVQLGRARDQNGMPSDARSGRTLSVFLLVLSCNSALVATLYSLLITGLAVHTHRHTGRPDVWFSDAASQAPAFVFPRFLRFLRHDVGHDASEADTEQASRTGRIRLDEEHITPTLQTILYQIQSREHSRHTPAPDCSCGEKLPWVPTQAEEYRAVGQIYARVWAIAAETQAQVRARTLGGNVGRHRSWSVPVPSFRLPTDRERRRTMFLVSFDAA